VATRQARVFVIFVRANATVYTIDPRGLDAGPDINQQVNPVAWQNHLTRSRNSLRVLVDLTGGFAAVDRNDFKSALARIDAETSDVLRARVLLQQHRRLRSPATHRGEGQAARTDSARTQ
jgi:hypothetical protein